MVVERLSLELTRRCGKGCSFCYNGSNREGETRWSGEEVGAFVEDCARHGTLAVSFGGGEPTEHPELLALLERLEGRLFRSLTTHGLGLEEKLEGLRRARPDKVHVSVHYPERRSEVERVARQVLELERAGLRSGVNLLVSQSQLEAARAATEYLVAQGIGLERVTFLPKRGGDTPSPEEVARVAGAPRFQSMTCLARCGPSPRFAAVAWDRSVAWCSYTSTRRPLEALTHEALARALQGLGLTPCAPLVPLRRAAPYTRAGTS